MCDILFPWLKLRLIKPSIKKEIPDVTPITNTKMGLCGYNIGIKKMNLILLFN